MTLPAPGAVAELVRLPAVLSVPGDALLGSAAAARPAGGRLAVSSSLLYLGGMALNDYADRTVDALERPHRPIPSGRVRARTAKRIAVGLTAAGVACAAALGGRPALRTALPLAVAVWAYDVHAKSTAWGPAAMSACRVLDVLLGASGGRLRDAVPAAAVVGAHTASITLVSRHEVSGGDPSVARAAVARTAAVAAATGLLGAVTATARARSGRWSRTRSAVSAATSIAFAAQYARLAGGGFAAAVRTPDPATLQRAVGTGVVALAPLQAGLLAGAGAVPQAAGIAAAAPLAKALTRRRGVS